RTHHGVVSSTGRIDLFDPRPSHERRPRRAAGAIAWSCECGVLDWRSTNSTTNCAGFRDMVAAMSTLTAKDREALEADRLSGMRKRLGALAVLNVLIWSSQAFFYDDQIFPSRLYAIPYRLAELVDCLALLWLVSRKRSMRDLELGAVMLVAALMPI